MHLSGLGAALLASILFNVGIVLQAIDARVAPKSLELRVGLLTRLLRRPLWLLGLALGLLGVWPQAIAYSKAPFVLVQPVLALGLLIVLLLGVRVLHERVGGREIAGVIGIIAGVLLVAWGAPAHSEAHRGPAAVLAVFGGLAFVGILPFLVRGTRFDSGMLTIVATGCAFGATNVATKLLGDDINAGHYSNAALWAAAGFAMGVLATLVNMTAFQRRPATRVVPISTAVQTFLPIVLEPFFLVEHWGSALDDGIPVAAGLAVALVGIVLLSSSHAVGDMIAEAG